MDKLLQIFKSTRINSRTEPPSPDTPPLKQDRRAEFVLGDFTIDSPASRPLKVIIIGSGFSGIAAGIRFLQRVPNVDVVIYDKNAGIGGAWYTNRYPGLACDIPSHCYQYTFFPNTQWSAAYAPGPEILAYLQNVVSTYELEPYIKLQHEMLGAKWDQQAGKWRVQVRKLGVEPGAPSETFEDVADVLFTGVGSLSRWQWPSIEGLHDFKGSLVHSASWDVWQEDAREWKNMKVGVIGVGSSAIQIVPSLQPHVGKLYNYVRGKTWLALPFAGEKIAELMNKEPGPGNYIFSKEERQAFRDPAYYKQFRVALESDLNSVHQGTLRGSNMQKGAREAFKANMLKRLAKKPWIADHLIPDFGVACRRLTPGPGYLEALCEDNVEFIPTHIKRVTATGIETVDGKHQELDVLICATGFDTSYNFPFTLIGRDGIDIRDKWAPHPRTYLSVCVDGFPNWFFSLGPNSNVGSGSLLALMEYQVDYAVAATLKLQRERLKSIEVKEEAVADYDEYIETVYSEKCRSWYKAGKEEGRVVGLWPGSCLHALTALQYPRWEDFNYERVDGQRNRLHWLGNGMTHAEATMSGNRAWYLREDFVDIPPVPLRPKTSGATNV
ncbi:FAD/NAD-binding domain-containing protein [Trametopsis cervina]|nr:FAD/NAD-binding domain-containing protein [Trametopsis cervina]